MAGRMANPQMIPLVPSIEEIDRNLQRIRAERLKRDAEEAPYVRAAWEAEVHRRLGYATFVDYIADRFGLDRDEAADKVRRAGVEQGLAVERGRRPQRDRRSRPR